MKRSFKNKIYRAFLVGFTITILCSAAVVFGVALPSVYESNLKSEQELTDQTSKRVDEYLNQINSLCIQVSYTRFTRSVLEKYYDGNTEERLEYTNDSEQMSQLYQDFLRAYNGVDGIFIYNLYGYPYYFFTYDRVNRYYDVHKEYWYNVLLNSTDYGQILISGIQTPPQIPGSSKFISLYRNIRDLRNHDIIGQAEILIRPRTLKKLISESSGNTSDKHRLTLLDSSGHVICSTQDYEPGDSYDLELYHQITSQANPPVTSASSHEMSIHYSEYSDWYLISEYDSDVLYKDINIIVITFISFSLLALTAMAIWGHIIAQQVTKPMALLKDGVANIQKGFFDNTINLKSNDEFGELANAFNQMSEALKKYIQQIYDVEEQKIEAQMTALQAQINPHFTLNTINSVKHMAMLQNSTNIVSMLDDFSLLLSAAFRYPNELITIKEELNRIRAFFRIQEVESFGKIKLYLYYEEDILDCLTMGLVLQPIVENAIFHGIKPKMSSHQMESGNVIIRLTSNETSILIHVIDDGIGMHTDKVDELLSENSSGIGVKNVNMRIQLRFGKDYGLNIKSAPGEGCDVLLHIPKIKQRI